MSQNRPTRHRLTRCLLILAWTLSPPALPAVAQEGEPTDAERVERILELQREIDELLAQLPPHLREELRKQLAAAPLPEPEGTPAPPVAAAATPPVPSAPAPPPDSEPAVSEAVSEAPDTAPEPVSPPPPPPRRWRRSRIECNTLAAFDTNSDGTVNAQDRYWRYLYLWLDRDRDGQIGKREVLSTFEEKVREISTDLDRFATLKRGLGEIRVADHIQLDLRGNGFDAERSRDDAVLLVDASALSRGAGPQLLSATGEPIEGVQPFQRGWRLRDSEGNVTHLSCP